MLHHSAGKMALHRVRRLAHSLKRDICSATIPRQSRQFTNVNDVTQEHAQTRALRTIVLLIFRSAASHVATTKARYVSSARLAAVGRLLRSNPFGKNIYRCLFPGKQRFLLAQMPNVAPANRQETVHLYSQRSHRAHRNKRGQQRTTPTTAPHPYRIETIRRPCSDKSAGIHQAVRGTRRQHLTTESYCTFSRFLFFDHKR